MEKRYLRYRYIDGEGRGEQGRLASTMTLVPPMIRGSMNTQKMSYTKQSGSSMHATCTIHVTGASFILSH